MTEAPDDHAEANWRGWIDRPWVVLLLLFCVMAILGLPVLWLSRGFSKPMKIVLSVVVSVYTVFLLWVFFKIMYWCYTRITEAL